RHYGRYPGLPAVVCPLRRRGPAVLTAGHRLHRLHPGFSARVADRNARPVLLSAAAIEGGASEARQSSAAVAQVGGRVSHSIQHETRGFLAPDDLAAGWAGLLATDPLGQRLPAAVR